MKTLFSNSALTVFLLSLVLASPACKDSDANLQLADTGELLPASLEAAGISGHEILLQWKTDGAIPDGFEVERSGNGKVFSVIALLTSGKWDSFTDTVPKPEKMYYYRIRSYRQINSLMIGYSPYSNIVPAATVLAPSDLKALVFADSQIGLVWTDNSSREAGFVLLRSEDGQPFTELAIVDENVTGYRDTSVTAQTAYAYKAMAFGPAGSVSEYCDEALGTTPMPPWAHSYCGHRNDEAYSIAATADGGYVVVGTTQSFGAGLSDIWVLKFDEEGAVEWEKAYGGEYDDYARSVAPAPGGGFIVAGDTTSFGAGLSDVWILNLESDGAIGWEKTYGGASFDHAAHIAQMQGGGFIVAGSTYSFGAGSTDCWLLELEPDGSVAWQKTYGGPGEDYARSAVETADGGFIAVGATSSYGLALGDYWVLKLDGDGAIEWQKTYGRGGEDHARSILEVQDGGYVVAGDSTSFSNGFSDIWALKLQPDGEILWQRAIGGYGDEHAQCILEGFDHSIVVAGDSDSFNQRDSDLWVVMLGSGGALHWQKAYGGLDQDYGRCIARTGDGGFALGGDTTSFGPDASDFWILRVNPNGTILFDPASGARLEDTKAVVIKTKVSPVDSTAAGAATNVTPEDTNAVVTITNCMLKKQTP